MEWIWYVVCPIDIIDFGLLLSVISVYRNCYVSNFLEKNTDDPILSSPLDIV